MTSKTLFHKLYQDTFKRHVWLLICMFITFILCKPVGLLIMIQNWEQSSYIRPEDLISLAGNQVSFSSLDNCGLMLPCAVLLGIVLFSYLFFTKKVNLYHSLPIKREKLFFAHYLVGLTIFLLAFIPNMILELIVIATQGYYHSGMIADMLICILITTLFFLSVYGITILAVMLTGHPLIALAATGTLLLITPLIHETIEAYYTNYMSTFYEIHTGLWYYLTSPILSIMYYINDPTEKGIVVVIIATIILTVLELALTLYLYKIRPSEASGRPLAFKVLAPIVRMIMVVLAALVGGLFIQTFTSELSTVWFWLFMVIFGILAHCIMEVLLKFDFSSALSDRLQMIIAVAIACVIGACFQFDLLGYDQYVPKADKIQTAAVYFPNFDRGMDYYDIDEKGDDLSYINRREHVLTAMELTDLPTVLDMVSIAKEQTIAGINNLNASNNYPYRDGEDNPSEPMGYFIVRYHMKSGKEISRCYRATLASISEDVEKIYDNPEYKAGAYQLKELADSGCIYGVTGSDFWGDPILNLKDQKVDEFLDAYEQDFYAQKFSDTKGVDPIMEINLVSKQNTAYGYYVYSNYEHTLALLDSYGIDPSLFTREIDPSKIEWISVDAWDYDNLEYSDDSAHIVYQSTHADDVPKIKEIASVATLDTFSMARPDYYETNSNLMIEMSYKASAGMTNTYTLDIHPDDVPEFLTEEIMEQMNGSAE